MLDLRRTPGRPLIAPSILSADFARLGEEAGHVLDHGADLLHLDVMDGHFTPNLTMGPALCSCLRKAIPGAFLDVHLMVEHPELFVDPFIKAGANNLTFHAEVLHPDECRRLADRVRRAGATAGLAINPSTDARPLLSLAASFDLVLVMSVNPGYSGQAFMPEVLPKTRLVRDAVGRRVRVQMDGGVSLTNAERVRSAGCDVIVAATAIFGVPRPERAGVIAGLKGPE
ncbi:MAG: ribulose-phosphate 3-epimerase [Phycisphaerae bacterium]